MINIENIGGVSPISDAALDENITPWNKVPIYRHVTTKIKDKGEYIKKDEFIISVAKGKTTTIKQTFTLSLSTMVSGSYYDKAELGFKMLYRLQYKKADTYTGPTDGEGGNSKEYRVRFLCTELEVETGEVSYAAESVGRNENRNGCRSNAFCGVFHCQNYYISRSILRRSIFYESKEMGSCYST